jgi:hypothetical protein
MGRRTSGQTVGLQTIGNVQASAATLTTTQTNQNLAIDPNGTGAVDVFASVTVNGDMTIANQGDLRLLESSANGTNFIALQAAANMAANYTLTWPAAVTGTSGFFLSSDTSGNLSWTSAASGIPVSDPGSTATVHYPLFGTNGGAVPTTLTPLARSNLSFIPSTGTLSSAEMRVTASSASTSVGSGALVVTGGVGIGGQMTAASIVETSSITLKENVTPIANALESILKLSGVTYDRIDTKEHEAGLIAEWVDEVLPDLVTKDALGNTIGIKYTKLTAYLIESIKTLNQEINELKGLK